MRGLRILVFSTLALYALGFPAHASPKADLRSYEDMPKKPLASVKTIVIDPGHGGKDFGATGDANLKEKDVVLRISLRLREFLTHAGFRVIMTRENDRFLSLQERAQIVNTHDADFFLSVHANAAKNKYARGYETFYLSDPQNDSCDPEKIAEDSDYHYEHFFDNQKELGKVYLGLLDKASSEDRAKSIDLADKIHDALKERIRAKDRGVKRARFFVLKNTDIPAVLIEVGFLSNAKEETLLKSPRYQGRIAQAIAEGLIVFRRTQDSAHRVVGR